MKNIHYSSLKKQKPLTGLYCKEANGNKMYFREGTMDEAIFNCVPFEYPIEHLNPENIIVDIGAHVGCFVNYAVTRGGKNIYAFEPNSDNFSLLKKNTCHLSNTNINIFHMAVYDTNLSEQLKEPKILTFNTGGANVLQPENDIPVKAICLDNIIKNIVGGKNIDVLKIDCEGSEYPILYSCTMLRKVDYIVMEHHVCIHPKETVEKYKYDFTKEGMQDFLQHNGFTIGEDSPEYMIQAYKIS